MTALAKLETPLLPVSTSKVPWEPIGTHGLQRKILGYDEQSGHVTFLLDIPAGWHGGGVAHYHECCEEVLLLSGSVTLDGSHYWHAGDYFYRPAHVVHGIDEKSEEGARALVRCDARMELLLVHEPDSTAEYPLPAFNDPRGHVFDLPLNEAHRLETNSFPDAWDVRALSENAQTGARTILVTIPAGWEGDPEGPGQSWEAYCLDGEVSSAETTYGAGDYTVGDGSTPPFAARASKAGARFILWCFDKT